MRFSNRMRKMTTVGTLAALVVASTVTPASAVYNPKLGVWMQRDPNGTGVPMLQGLPYNAANPTVTVNMAYELQYGDGMNLYQYVQSNPVNRRDPSGLATDWGTLRSSFGKWAPSVLDLATFGGYFSGLRFANMQGGWGPPTTREALNMAWGKAGLLPGSRLGRWASWGLTSWLPSTTLLLEKHGNLDILGRKLAGAIRATNRVAGVWSSVTGGPVSWLAAPFIAAGAGYVGVIDAVLWTVENDF